MGRKISIAAPRIVGPSSENLRWTILIMMEPLAPTELSLEAIERITGMPAPNLGAYARGEKRQSIRLPVSVTADLWLNQGQTQEFVAVKVRNISQSGVELICRSDLQNGTTFHLRFAVKTGSILLQSQTVRCNPIASGLYLVAAIFVRGFEEQQDKSLSRNRIRSAISDM